MKKIIALLCAVAMVFGLAACGGSSDSAADNAADAVESVADAAADAVADAVDDAAEAVDAAADVVAGTVNTNDVINVGFVQLVDMPDASMMHDSFLQRLEDEGYADKIVVDFQSASGDVGTMSTIIQGFVDNEYDVIVPMLTPPTQASVSIAGGEIPIIYMSVVDPIYSGINPDWETVDPSILATGTSNTIPADLLIDTAQAITPLEEGKEIVIMYNTSQNNSECTMEAAKAYCEEQDLAYTVIGYADVTDALTQAQALNFDEVGYVYVTLDSIIAASFNQLGQLLAEKGVPCYGVADAMVLGGAFLSYGVDYNIVGEMTADMLIDWYNGAALEDLTPQRYSDFNLVVNADVMNEIGVELPAEYADIANYVQTQ